MGKSTRFPEMRPKWMLTHPTGNFMAIAAIEGLDLTSFTNIFFVTHEAHETEYQFSKTMLQQVQEIHPNVQSEILLLDFQTQSQPETVYETIVRKNITGPILVKDSDNFFEVTNLSSSNYICYFDLNDDNVFNAKNKSYIDFDKNNFISNIVEKKIISSTFSVGGYGFSSAEEFCDYFLKVGNLTTEVYMSNIIFEMLLAGKQFTGHKVSLYDDWGTLDEWNRYKKTYKTLFVDIDGVLIENTSPYTFPFNGSGNPLTENIKVLQKLHSTGRVVIILTTARPSSHRDITVAELNKYHIPYDTLLMDLPHSERIIVNDFAKSNPYPSCNSINIQRNSNNLKDYFYESSTVK